QQTDTSYDLTDSSNIWLVMMNQVSPTASSSATATVSKRKERMTGFATSCLDSLPCLIQETSTLDADNNQTKTTVKVTRGDKLVSTTIDDPDSSTDQETVMRNGLVQSRRTKTNLTTTYGYDGIGHQTSVVDPRTGASTTHYNDAGQVDYTLDAA